MKAFHNISLTIFFFVGFWTLSSVTGQTDSLSIPEKTLCQFPGGVDSLYRCIEQSFRISRPDFPYDQYQDLTCDVKFSVNKKGQVVSVNTGPSPIEYELERALMNLPPFNPATLKGKPVNSYVELKFMFMIKGNRMEVLQHLQYHSSARDKDSGWLKAGLVATALVVFLLYWGI
jgi:hypothetical protein